MKNIKEHIKTGSFSKFYLLYGGEAYLKKLYRDKLKAAIIPDEDNMNYSYFEGKDMNQKEVVSICQTLPFFSERRLIVIENSGLFKSSNELADQLKELPDTTIVIFVEMEVDKRNKLYKLVKDQGTISEMNGLDEQNLKLFISSLLKAEGKRITENTITHFMDRTGSDMEHMRNEVAKLASYTGDRDLITIEDIDAIVTVQITGKIFQMIDAIASKQQDRALSMYYELLALREKPMSILFLITRHFNILLKVRELGAKGGNNASISEKVGIPPFSVNKYLAQSKNFNSKRLIDALEFATEMEEQIKTGRMIEKIGVELMIVNFSKR